MEENKVKSDIVTLTVNLYVFFHNRSGDITGNDWMSSFMNLYDLWKKITDYKLKYFVTVTALDILMKIIECRLLWILFCVKITEYKIKDFSLL